MYVIIDKNDLPEGVEHIDAFDLHIASSQGVLYKHFMAKAFPPTENPAKVRVTNEQLCNIHGWQLNSMQAVRYKEIEPEVPRDKNGYNIYVMSKTHEPHPVYLCDTHYSLD